MFAKKVDYYWKIFIENLKDKEMPGRLQHTGFNKSCAGLFSVPGNLSAGELTIMDSAWQLRKLSEYEAWIML